MGRDFRVKVVFGSGMWAGFCERNWCFLPEKRFPHDKYQRILEQIHAQEGLFQINSSKGADFCPNQHLAGNYLDKNFEQQRLQP
jgi:hypothetical protein